MEVKTYYYNAGGMTQFRYPEDTYAGWAILVPQSGRFSFAIHEGAKVDGTASGSWRAGAGGSETARAGVGGDGTVRFGVSAAEVNSEPTASGVGGDGTVRFGVSAAEVNSEPTASGGPENSGTGGGTERIEADVAEVRSEFAGRAGAVKAVTDETRAAPYNGEAAFGELVLCPPGFVLKRSMLEPTSFHFIELAVSDEFALPPGKVRIRDVQRLGSTCSYLARLRAEQSCDYQEEIAHLIRDLLYLVRLEQASAAASRRATTEPLMHHAAALMERGACEPDFSLQRIAVQCGLRASQLSTRFQAAYGLSPIRYATSVRLAKAAKLLVETDLTLDDVAERCGYQNAFYFSRVFSKQMNISPSLFRRANRV
ncbi:helix-turn-helix domain-containing protein [Cohnella rhizosphaerae]|uniref:AraC family transcriptional regulator n=1 Tax=Cohnella rhizosphaerae TaxID=1457232 RepID=A0A9X4KPX3_9BACL|nr:AraC family transcriptional regulator [Cohnella rhizosphaerae]MDG0809031.1 AraC family transcriptional regulator [Cohnella rhizosphaerae]